MIEGHRRSQPGGIPNLRFFSTRKPYASRPGVSTRVGTNCQSSFKVSPFCSGLSVPFRRGLRGCLARRVQVGNGFFITESDNPRDARVCPVFQIPGRGPVRGLRRETKRRAGSLLPRMTKRGQLLLFRHRSSRIEAIKVQNRVEHERIAALRLAAIDRIHGKQHDVPMLHRHIDHRGVLSDLVPSFD